MLETFEWTGFVFDTPDVIVVAGERPEWNMLSGMRPPGAWFGFVLDGVSGFGRAWVPGRE